MLTLQSKQQLTFKEKVRSLISMLKLYHKDLVRHKSDSIRRHNRTAEEIQDALRKGMHISAIIVYPADAPIPEAYRLLASALESHSPYDEIDLEPYLPAESLHHLSWLDDLKCPFPVQWARIKAPSTHHPHVYSVWRAPDLDTEERCVASEHAILDRLKSRVKVHASRAMAKDFKARFDRISSTTIPKAAIDYLYEEVTNMEVTANHMSER